MLARAVRLLARRDMSRAELEARLAPRRGPRDDSAIAVDDNVLAGQQSTEPGPDDSVATVADGASSKSGASLPVSRDHRFGAQDVAAAIERLQALGLQSDARFAENFVRARASRSGSRRLQAELRQRGIDATTIEAATAALADNELQRARALWARRFQPSRDPRERAKQTRFLASRGFPLAVIRKVLGGDPEDLPGDD